MKAINRLIAIKGFIAGFLICALLLGGASTFADGFWANIDVLFNSVKIHVNATPTDLENIVYNGRTYVPLRALSDIFGKGVQYNAADSTVNIVDKSAIQLISKDVAFLVNGQPVRVDFFTQMANWYKLASGITQISNADAGAFKDFVRDEVVKMLVTEQLAGDLSIAVSASDKRTMEDNIKVFATNFGGPEGLAADLEQNGISYETYYYIQNNNVLRSKLLDAMAPQITSTILYNFYDENKDSFKEEKVHTKHILVKTTDENGYPLPEEYKQKAKDRINRIYNDLKVGTKTFDAAMNMYSEDPGLKTNPDGYTFGKGEMVKIYEDTSYSLQVGEISKVIESEYGYHIIKLEDRFTTYVPYENVKSSIYNNLRMKQSNEILTPNIQKAEIIFNNETYADIHFK